MARDAHELGLPGDRKVVLVELKTSQMLKAMEAATSASMAASEFASALEGLRLSIVEIDGTKVGYMDLAGDFWDQQFSMAETTLLVQAWRRIHSPEPEDLAGLEGNLKARAT